MNPSFSRPRRLLVVSYHFPPSGAVAVYRMLGFARHLPRSGWDVGVVAPPCVPGEPLDERLLERVPPETAVFSVPYPRNLPANVLRRYLYNGVWLPSAVPALMRAVRTFQPDAVLTSGPPHCVHVLGLLLKRIYHLPWVADFRDPWSTNNQPGAPWSPWVPWERFWEKRALAAADTIIANTPLGCQGFHQAYPQWKHKIACVTNGYDPECFPTPPPLKPINGRLTILHAGELYCGRDPRPFFDAVQACESERPASQAPFRLHLLGQATENRFDLDNLIQERHLEHVVELGGQVPYAAALDAMTHADVLLVIDTPGRKVGIPAKLFEYLGAGRPVLALAEPDGDVAWALKASGAPHRVAPSLDVGKIRQSLLELSDGLRNQRLLPPSPQQKSFFTRARLAENLAGHLDNMLLANHRASRSAARSDATTPPMDVSLFADDNHHAVTADHVPKIARRPHYSGA